MIDFRIPPETAAIVEGLLGFIDGTVRPLEEEHRELLEDDHAYYGPDGRLTPPVLDLMRQVRMASARAGYYTLFLPEDLGGRGQGPLTLFLAWEALYHHVGARRPLSYQTLAHWATGPNTIMRGLAEHLKAEALPRLVSGEVTSCFALSEPGAGSDAWAIQTRAERDGDGWTINGTKKWITNAPYATYALLFAVTDPEQVERRQGGVSCFFVETSSPGFIVEEVIRLYGHPGGNEGLLRFQDLRVPGDRLVGELHRGFALALSGVNTGRIYNAARSVGLSRWALEQATRYAQERVAFGQPIAEYQGVQWLLADSAIETYAARMMSLNCAWRLEQGQAAVKETAMVKAFATEAGYRTLDRCMQVLGALGLTNEARLYDAWHQLRTVRIADGSGEVMRRTIAHRLFRGDLEF